MTQKKYSSTCDAVIGWIEQYLVIPDGARANQPMRLTDHQKDWLETIYGSPTRKFILSIPRKNGKTAIAAAILLFELCARKSRHNAQIVSVAMTREQASIMFKLARDMIRKSDYLNRKIRIVESKKQLIFKENNNVYQALSSDASNALGLSPVVAFLDEVGQIKGQHYELYNSLITAQGAHENPLLMMISTQAAADTDFFSLQIDDARKGEKANVKVVVYEAPENLDPFSDEAIIAANPHVNVTTSMAELRDRADEASRMPSQSGAYKNLHLNQRVSQAEYFCSREVWMANDGQPDEDLFVKGRCYFGIDLSNRGDLTAMAMIARDHEANWHVKLWHYAPSENLKDRCKTDHFAYDLMAMQGYLTLIPGASIDNRHLAPSICQLFDQYNPTTIGFDPYGMAALTREFELMGRQLPLEKVAQNFTGTTGAIEILTSALLNGKVKHGSNPLLNWCVSNASTLRDGSGNTKLDKKEKTRRIDGLAALVTAFAAAAKDDSPDISQSYVVREYEAAAKEGRSPEWALEMNEEFYE